MPLMLYVSVVQVTCTLVTLLFATVPEPLVTRQVCSEGCPDTDTEYVDPGARAWSKVKTPLALTPMVSPPSLFKVSEPVRPDTVPPIV